MAARTSAPIFACRAGTFAVEITDAVLTELGKLLHVDVVSAWTTNGQQLLTLLVNRPAVFVRILWDAIEHQAEVRGIEPEDFGRALTIGAAFDRAFGAFTRAMAKRFPNAPVSAGVRSVWGK